MGQGIDLSQHNAFINWDEAVKGLDFVIIRCGFGQDSTSQDDVMFERNVTECIKRNIPYGIYFYSYALNISGEQGEINHVLRLLENKKPSLPVFIDMEDADGYKRNHGGIPSKQTNTDIVKMFCNAMVKAGYSTGWYCNKDWYINHFYPEQLTTWNFWYARPGVSESTIKAEVNAQLWQNGIGETGSRWNGVNGFCDTNISYLDNISNNYVQSQPILTEQSPIDKAKQFVGNKCLELQQKLNKLGYHLAEDGIFGQNTYNALINFQGKNGLTRDGLCGTQTWNKINELLSRSISHINNNILVIQQKLNKLKIGNRLVEDGISGTNTINAIKLFQSICGIGIDGIWGNQSENCYQQIVSKPLCGIAYVQRVATRYLQYRLGISIDGIFGNNSANAVKNWQSRNGLLIDGVIGNASWSKLIG